MVLMDRKDAPHGLGHLDFGHSILPFDLAQGGEPVEPFRVSDFVLRICDIKAETPHAPLGVLSEGPVLRAGILYPIGQSLWNEPFIPRPLPGFIFLLIDDVSNHSVYN